jgi:DNA-binding PadR family transcriptional regulator
MCPGFSYRHSGGLLCRVSKEHNGGPLLRPSSGNPRFALFPALHRMQEEGREPETNRRAKFYKLSKTGRKRRIETSDANQVATAIIMALKVI